MLHICILWVGVSMPSFRNALFLFCNDRSLFIHRLKVNFLLFLHNPSFFFRRTKYLNNTVYGEILNIRQPRCLVIFSSNPFSPSGIGTSILAQCTLLQRLGIALDAVFYVLDDFNINDYSLLKNKFERVAIVYTKNISQKRLSDGVTARCLDSWCSSELMETCVGMATNANYNGIIVHQPWLSKVLEVFPDSAIKYLFMHDNFVGRASLFQKQGLPITMAWLNLSEAEQVRCMLRADIIFSVQEEEKKIYEKQLNCRRKVVNVKIPFSDNTNLEFPTVGEKLKVGILASSNENNRVAVRNFLDCWEKKLGKSRHVELFIGGEICCFLKTSSRNVYLLGRIEDLTIFYKSLHLVVNPDLGGTGIKVKSLEALSFGRPLLTGIAGSRGLNSNYPWHTLPDRESMVDSIENFVENKEALNSLRDISIKLFKDYSIMDSYISTLEDLLE